MYVGGLFYFAPTYPTISGGTGDHSITKLLVAAVALLLGVVSVIFIGSLALEVLLGRIEYFFPVLLIREWFVNA